MGVSDSMKSIISDVRHSADVDKYTKEQRQFLWSIADRLEAARAQNGADSGEAVARQLLQTVIDRHQQWEDGAEVTQDIQEWLDQTKVFLSTPTTNTKPPANQVPKNIRAFLKACVRDHSQKRKKKRAEGNRASSKFHEGCMQMAEQLSWDIPNLLSTQPDAGAGQWIPCSERLPTDDDGFIWVYSTHTKSVLWRPHTWRDINMWTERDKCLWMPANLRKPQPPQGEE